LDFQQNVDLNLTSLTQHKCHLALKMSFLCIKEHALHFFYTHCKQKHFQRGVIRITLSVHISRKLAQLLLK